MLLDCLKKGLTCVVVILLVVSMLCVTVSNEENYNIPFWIKNNTKWWSTGQISDSNFIEGIQYLIQQGIITTSQTGSNTTGPNHIPFWVRDDAGWWANNQIGDSDFVRGMQYLVVNNIIHLGKPVEIGNAVNSANQTTGQNIISADLNTRLEGNTTGIYYPLYDLSELSQVLAAKQAFPNVPFDVNINPESGPGTGPSTDWASAIVQLKSAGAIVTGYVPTGYGTERSVADVEGMISSYNQFYPNMLDGIMFDEVSGSCSEFTFYQTVSNYARSLGYSYIRANPGGPICQTDIPLFNHIAIYESTGYPSESTLASNTLYPQYSKNVVGFGATVHTQPTYDPTWLHMATKYLKWVYITDRAEPDPYSVFPSYFHQYLTDLSSLAGNKTMP